MATKTPLESALSEQIQRDYHILKLLGEGGMGQVYLAEQVRVGHRRVALKVLRRAYSESATAVRRFENEAASAGLIHHRNVVTIYESRATDDGQLYVAMEYVEGRSLREVLDEQQALPLETVVEITKQVCAGIDAAHRLGIVHRDIKPDNIMLAEEDGAQVVKVLDFGIARLSEPGTSGTRTKTGAVFGTPAYMSPEQAAGWTGDKIDARSDIYSLGMVIYEMLTGRVAFEAESWLGVLHQQMQTPPALLNQLRPELKLPAGVERVILKALAKERTQRQQTILELARELEAAWLQAKPSRLDAGLNALPATTLIRRDSPSVAAPAPPSAPTSVITIPQREPQAPSAPAAARKLKFWSLGILLVSLVGLALIPIVRFVLFRPSQVETTAAPLAAGMSPGAAEVSPAPLPWNIKLMAYRVGREKPAPDLDRLSLNNIVRSDERIYFQVKLERPGSVYLLYKQADGSMLWLGAVTDGQARFSPPGEWLSIPERIRLKVGEKLGVENILVIYVPSSLKWSIREAMPLSKIPVRDEGAIIPPEAALKISDFLKQEAVELKPSGTESGTPVSHQLSKAGEADQIAFYEIKLNHLPKE